MALGLLVATACTPDSTDPPAGDEPTGSTTGSAPGSATGSTNASDDPPPSTGAPADPDSSTTNETAEASTGSTTMGSTETEGTGDPLDVETVVELYGQAWNIADPDERVALLETIWDPAGTYGDPVTVEQGLDGSGVDGLSEVIEFNHQQLPGFSIDIVGSVDHYESMLRFDWLFLLPDGTPIPGFDFGEIDPDSGQLRRITGFFGELPQGNPISAPLQAYLDAWNEPDPAVRLDLLTQAMSDDAVYIDPTAAVEGRPQLVDHIGLYQQQAAGTELVLTAGPDTYDTVMRFSWAIHTLGGDVVGTGLDVVDLADDGRLSRVVGFFDFEPGR
ncbi:MAG: nuclear transport factor 2 family protein [Myxococcota bacterium]